MIKAIIFDLGGVILNLDFDLTIDGFKRLGANYFDCFYTKENQSEIFDHFETGKLTPDEFRYHLKNLLGIPPHVPNLAFDEAWNAMLLDLPAARLDFIHQLKKQGYQTYLLSNTNPIHLKKFNEIIKNTLQLESLAPYFNKQYFSHLVGLRKPEGDIFIKVLNEHHLNAHEVLFVDDTLQNISSAKNMGISAFHITKKNQIFDLNKMLE